MRELNDPHERNEYGSDGRRPMVEIIVPIAVVLLAVVAIVLFFVFVAPGLSSLHPDFGN